MHRSRLRLAVALVALAAVIVPGPIGTRPAKAAGDVTRSGSLSLTESPGCDGPYGIRGPYATRAGWVPATEPILGPWGDIFGRTIGDAHDRLVSRQLPMTDWGVTVWVHQAVAPALDLVIANLEREAAAGNHYTIRNRDTWSYHSVTIPPGRHLSFHAVGAAIDVNSTTNPYRSDNVLQTDMPEWFVRAWTDAGWCWGGDWQTIKDPMHFSWRGPVHTPGYEAAAPIPPANASSNFRSSIEIETHLGPTAPGTTHLIADTDRDGAPDPIRIRAWTPAGHAVVEVAKAQHDFETCTIHGLTDDPPHAPDGWIVGDTDGDIRPDVVALDASGATLLLGSYAWSDDYRSPTWISTAVPTSDGATYLLADHDWDGHSDLYVARRGNPGHLEIWSGPHFDTRLVDADLGFAITAAQRIGLGDRDIDGTPDLYVLGPGPDARLRIVPAAAGFAAATGAVINTAVGEHADATFQVADLDGDGHDDLLFFDHNGVLTAYQGGVIAPGTDVTTWFSESWDRHWTDGEGCPPAPGFDAGSPGFGEVEAAFHLNGTGAFVFPRPQHHSWMLADLSWRWWLDLSGPAVAIESLVTGGAAAHAVAVGGTSPHLLIVEAHTGAELALVPLAEPPIGLAVSDPETNPRLALLFAGPTPRIDVLEPDGTLRSSIPLAGSPRSIAVASTSLVVAGTGAAGGTIVQIATGEAAAPERVIDPDLEPVALAEGTAFAAVLVRTPGDAATTAVILDAATGAEVARFAVRSSTSAAAVIVPGPVLVVSSRDSASGQVVTDRWSLPGGYHLFEDTEAVGYDPADLDYVQTRGIAILSHRYGDAMVELEWRRWGIEDVTCDGETATIVGTRGADRLVGTAGRDVIAGLEGNDIIFGGGGDDLICGDSGDDELAGQGGADRVLGGRGNDVIGGGPGDDQLDGGAGQDLIEGGNGNDLIHGGPGHDHDPSWYRGQPGVAPQRGEVPGLHGGPGNDIIYGGSGRDHLFGDDGEDELHGGSQNDRIFGSNDSEVLDGGPGNDLIKAGAGDDVVIGGTMNDRLIGGTGNDEIWGGPGRDLIKAADGDDLLYGEEGNDDLRAGSGIDLIDGGPDRDACREGETVLACETS